MSDEQSPPPPDEVVRVRRGVDRARYDEDAVHAVLDAGLVAHVGTVRDGLPVVIPMFCVRDGDHLLLHGAPASGVIQRGRAATVCVTMTMLDGLVLARSAFHHSVNYRSVTVIGEATEVVDDEAKARALEVFVERLVPGRQAMLRPTNDKEHRGTSVLSVPLAAASVKIRTGAPIDDDEDYDEAVWAGTVPLNSTYGAPIDDPALRVDVGVPANVVALEGRTL